MVYTNSNEVRVSTQAGNMIMSQKGIEIKRLARENYFDFMENPLNEKKELVF